MAYNDVVLDALVDLRRVISGWSPEAWLLLAHTPIEAGGDIARARSRALVRAVEDNRLELVRFTREELRRQVPTSLETWEHDQAGEALEDAALSMIMADRITVSDSQVLLDRCRRASGAPSWQS